MLNFNIISKKLPFVLFIASFTLSSSVSAQDSLPEESFWSNVRFGGGVGATFSNGNFSGFLAPKAVYDFNRYTSAGVGLAGSYTDASRFTAYSLAGSIIGLLRPMQNIQLSAEFEENYVSRHLNFNGAPSIDDNYFYPSLFLGLGYTTGPVTAGVRYDVLHDDRSIYANAFMPFVSFYF